MKNILCILYSKIRKKGMFQVHDCNDVNNTLIFVIFIMNFPENESILFISLLFESGGRDDTMTKHNRWNFICIMKSRMSNG